MHDRLTDLSVRTLIERLATRDPTPGGGSASALAGAMGAALVHMVAELTGGADADRDEGPLGQIGQAAATSQSELLKLAELDASAYDAVVRARRLPRDSARERDARDTQLRLAVFDATRVPLETLRAAAAVLQLAERLAPLANRNAISDVGIGGMLAVTAIRGAALNVRINLPHVRDEELRTAAAATLEPLLSALESRERALAAAVAERMP